MVRHFRPPSSFKTKPSTLSPIAPTARRQSSSAAMVIGPLHLSERATNTIIPASANNIAFVDPCLQAIFER
jgi:hypothetical protein